MRKHKKILMFSIVLLLSTQSIVAGASEIIGNSSTNNNIEEIDTSSTTKTSQSTDESSKESTSGTEVSSSLEDSMSSEKAQDVLEDPNDTSDTVQTTEVNPELNAGEASNSALVVGKNLPKLPVNLGALPSKHSGNSPYRDISSSIYKKYINWIYVKGITTGYTPTTYKPDYYVTRGEMAVFLSRLAGSPSYKAPFNVYTDVTQYKNQILWLTATTVSTGTAPHYHPNGRVTRGQMAAFLHRMAKESGRAPKSGRYSTPFTDVQHNFFKNDIGWLYSKGITTGYTPTLFKPDAPITRGEMAAFLYRFYNKVSLVPPHVPVPDPWKYVISHRGSAERIEHTFAAYDLAIQQGSQNIEQDLVVSKDKTLYVSHDRSAKRLTGVDKLYSDMTDAEISTLRVANGEPIHTLQSVFERYGNRVNYIIELTGPESLSQVTPLVNMIRENGLENNVTVQNFDENVLKKFMAVAPTIPRMQLVENQSEFNKDLAAPESDMISVSSSLMNKTNIDKIHAQHKIASAWTLDSESSIEKAISLGVDNYFTNYTGRAIQLEKEYR